MFVFEEMNVKSSGFLWMVYSPFSAVNVSALRVAPLVVSSAVTTFKLHRGLEHCLILASATKELFISFFFTVFCSTNSTLIFLIMMLIPATCFGFRWFAVVSGQIFAVFFSPVIATTSVVGSTQCTFLNRFPIIGEMKRVIPAHLSLERGVVPMNIPGESSLFFVKVRVDKVFLIGKWLSVICITLIPDTFVVDVAFFFNWGEVVWLPTYTITRDINIVLLLFLLGNLLFFVLLLASLYLLGFVVYYYSLIKYFTSIEFVEVFPFFPGS